MNNSFEDQIEQAFKAGHKAGYEKGITDTIETIKNTFLDLCKND